MQSLFGARQVLFIPLAPCQLCPISLHLPASLHLPFSYSRKSALKKRPSRTRINNFRYRQNYLSYHSLMISDTVFITLTTVV